jgi:hypothetical protein
MVDVVGLLREPPDRQGNVHLDAPRAGDGTVRLALAFETRSTTAETGVKSVRWSIGICDESVARNPGR